jgi:thiamine pyrophosphokinase
MTAVIVTRPVPRNVKAILSGLSPDVVVAVDGAVKVLIDAGIGVDLAVGDFDSLDDQSVLDGIRTDRLPVDKDITDTARAIKDACAMDAERIVLVGGLMGQRADHFLANMTLFDTCSDLVIMDETNTIRMLTRGAHRITWQHHVSVFPYPEAVVTLKGFKYPLSAYRLKPFDALGVSNELTAQEGTVVVLEGRIILVESEEK